MLIGLDPLLGPDLLQALRAMGHGDDIVLADANFPAQSVARRLIRCDDCDLPRLLAAVLKVLPIDQVEPAAVVGMEVVGDAGRREPVHDDIARLLATQAQPGASLELIERHAFYARARDAFAVVATGERRFYGNVMLRKGTIAP
ncbi:RbsD/FucU family protein [Vineibacter terrae]|uniref:RbsD/FucU family protein n=1 Tax=Vineibacter terrae TaxID=2586908 RepID=UPI002E34B278|nr:RbsD/FucU domain-containing protein [Vineibacter terrae]HEX2890706.1 RbsD/FucU domain-containing protein [Vineibacter terrae]